MYPTLLPNILVWKYLCSNLFKLFLQKTWYFGEFDWLGLPSPTKWLKRDWPLYIQRPALGQQSTSKKHVTSISSKLEPVIWSHDTGQWIPCIDSCQLTITWMSKIKEVQYKPRVHVSLNLDLYGRHLGQLCCRHPYTPTGNAASHENHEKINSWVSLTSLYRYGALLGGSLGRWSSTIRPHLHGLGYPRQPFPQVTLADVTLSLFPCKSNQPFT